MNDCRPKSKAFDLSRCLREWPEAVPDLSETLARSEANPLRSAHRAQGWPSAAHSYEDATPVKARDPDPRPAG